MKIEKAKYAPLCRNDPDGEWAGDCFPTFNDMMRLDESDTDSDTPYLIGPSGIQSVSGERHGKMGQIKHGAAARSAVSDTDTNPWVNPTEIQEMVTIHMLMEEGWLPSDSEPISQENMIIHGSKGMGEDIAECSSGDASPERYRASDGAFYQPTRRWSPPRRRGSGDLIGEPIDPHRGQSGNESPRTVGGAANGDGGNLESIG